MQMEMVGHDFYVFTDAGRIPLRLSTGEVRGLWVDRAERSVALEA